MNLLRILGAYVLLLVAILLASNIALGIFAGDEPRQTLAVMIVLATGLVAALLVFALQRRRGRAALEAVALEVPAERRALLNANAAVATCIAACVLVWFWLGSLISRTPDAVEALRYAQWLPVVSSVVAALAVMSLCRQRAQLRTSAWLFRAAIILCVGLVGVALMPDIALRGLRGTAAAAPAGAGHFSDAWILLPLLAVAVCAAAKKK